MQSRKQDGQPRQFCIALVGTVLKLCACASPVAEPPSPSPPAPARHIALSGLSEAPHAACSSSAQLLILPNHLHTLSFQSKTGLTHYRTSTIPDRWHILPLTWANIPLPGMYPACPPLPLLTLPTREHSADDVYVTGTFDDWRKTVKLEKENGVFQKTVELPKTHTQYKVRLAHMCDCAVA